MMRHYWSFLLVGLAGCLSPGNDVHGEGALQGTVQTSEDRVRWEKSDMAGILTGISQNSVEDQEGFWVGKTGSGLHFRVPTSAIRKADKALLSSGKSITMCYGMNSEYLGVTPAPAREGDAQILFKVSPGPRTVKSIRVSVFTCNQEGLRFFVSHTFAKGTSGPEMAEWFCRALTASQWSAFTVSRSVFVKPVLLVGAHATDASIQIGFGKKTNSDIRIVALPI